MSPLFLILACSSPSPPAAPESVQPAPVVVLDIPPDPAWPSDPDADYPRQADDARHTLLTEEPDRGPWLTSETAPLPAGLSTTAHVHCEVLPPTLMCSKAVTAGQHDAVWEVSRMGPVVHKASRALRGDEPPVTWRWVYDETGGLERVTSSDPLHLLVAYTFSDDEMFYRARRRSGANAFDGCGLYNLEDDFDGRIIAETCLGWDGAPRPDTGGVVTRLHTYDDAGFIAQTLFTDADGTPTAAHTGVVSTRYERDDSGRVVRERREDAAGAPVISREDGCAAVAWTYASLNPGFVKSWARVTRTCVGPNQNPIADNDGVFERRVMHYQPERILHTHHGRDGAEVADRFGVSRRDLVYDRSGRPVFELCRSAGAVAPCTPGGGSLVDHDYSDGRTSTVIERHLNDRVRTVPHPVYKVRQMRFGHDAEGRQTDVTCHRDDGSRVLCPGLGVSRFVSTFDDAGRKTATRFEDAEGRMTDNLGVLERRFVYDVYDRLVQVRELADGTAPPSFSLQSMQYDPAGQLVAMLLFDEEHRPARYTGCFTGHQCPDVAWHAVRVVRDATGRVTGNRFFDAAGHLVVELPCNANDCWE